MNGCCKPNGIRKLHNGLNNNNNSEVASPEERSQEDPNEASPRFQVISTVFSFTILAIFGKIRDIFRCLGLEPSYTYGIEKNREDYPPLFQSFKSFFIRNVYRLARDCFHVPVVSVPGAKITFRDRTSTNHNWTFTLEESTKQCINLGSYNYLGFAETEGPRIDSVIESVYQNGCGVATSQQELGTHQVHRELNELFAKFLGVEDCITFGMGFATNTTSIPVLAGSGSLIISDELNHSSIILGAQASGATIRVFRHNDMSHLEELLESAVLNGDASNGGQWKKIIIVVEGLYSMEGTIVDLPRVIQLKKKFKAYLFIDEAHSIGALGKQGRGVVDYFGLCHSDVDILMGTLTKSFAAAGGYIGGSRRLINYIRVHSHSSCYATSMPMYIAQQVIESCRQIALGCEEGLNRIQRLSRNTRYFRRRLKQMGFIVYGNDDSPVVPVLLYQPSKVPYVSQFKGLGQTGVSCIFAKPTMLYIPYMKNNAR